MAVDEGEGYLVGGRGAQVVGNVRLPDLERPHSVRVRPGRRPPRAARRRPGISCLEPGDPDLIDSVGAMIIPLVMGLGCGIGGICMVVKNRKPADAKQFDT